MIHRWLVVMRHALWHNDVTKVSRHRRPAVLRLSLGALPLDCSLWLVLLTEGVAVQHEQFIATLCYYEFNWKYKNCNEFRMSELEWTSSPLSFPNLTQISSNRWSWMLITSRKFFAISTTKSCVPYLYKARLFGPVKLPLRNLKKKIIAMNREDVSRNGVHDSVKLR